MLLPLFVIETGLARWQQWWPKRHSFLPAAPKTIRTKLNHSNEPLYGSALFLIDHNKVVMLRLCTTTNLRWQTNAPPLLVILMALAIHRCNTKHISQWRWRTSWATLDATGRRHQATIRTVLPWRLPGSSVLAHTTKVVAVKRALLKLAAKRHKMDPLLTSSMPQAL